MSDISKISVGGVQYNIKDTVARGQVGAKVYTFSVSVPTTSWTAVSGGGYTKTISVSGMKTAYNPTCNVVLSTSSADTREAQLEAYSLITMITTADGSITVYCDGDKPETALTLYMEVVA